MHNPLQPGPSGTSIDNKQDITFIIVTKLRNLEEGAGYFLFTHPSYGEDSQHVLNGKGKKHAECG